MNEKKNTKPYDLEERTLKFAKEVIAFVNPAPNSIANVEIIKQLVRSSGSVGANYIEANEALSKKDRRVKGNIFRALSNIKLDYTLLNWKKSVR